MVVVIDWNDSSFRALPPALQADCRAIVGRGPCLLERLRLREELPALQARFAADAARRGLTPAAVHRIVFVALHPDRHPHGY